MAMSRNKDYDKRIFRLLSILNKLDAGQKISSRELAEDFNVSLRSVQRDLELLSRAGFLLSSPQKGIYSFEDGFSLKKMRLTNEEASLLSFLYEIASSLGENFQKSFRNILQKVIQKEYDSPYYAKLPKGIGLKADYTFTSDLEEAIDQCQKIELSYEKHKKIKKYTLCPLKVIYYEGFWYLLSQVDGKDWLLKFRLEQIKDVEVLDEYFEPPENLQTMLDQSVNIWFSERKTKKATLKIEKSAARFFKQRKYFPHQKIAKENKDGSLLVECRVSDYMEVIPTVLHWIPHIKVIDPKDLRTEIKVLVKDYLSG